MKTSCRFCDGIVDVVPESYQVSPAHVLCIGGFVATCQKCGRSSGFTKNRETALRSMTVNFDEGMGLRLAADIADALTWAKKDLPKTTENESTNKILRRTIARLKEYVEATTPNPKCDFKVGDLVMIHPIIGRPERHGPYTLVSIKLIAQNESIAWLNGIRGSVAVAALSHYVKLEGEK